MIRVFRSGSALQQVVWSLLALALLVGLFLIFRHDSDTHVAASSGEESKVKDNVLVSAAGSQALQLQVEPVRVEALSGLLKTTGLVSIPVDHTVKISPSLQGRVREVFVKIGDHVRMGQTLALMDSADAANAVNSERTAETALQLAKTTRERQERLFRLGTPDVTAAKEALYLAQQQQEYARIALQQQEEQARIGGFTQQPLATAETAVVAARTALRQANADYVLADKELTRTKELKDIGVASDRDLVAQQNTYDKAKEGAQGAEDSLKLAQDALDRERKAYKTGLYANQALATARNTKHQADLGVEAAGKTLRLAKAQVLRDLLQARSDYKTAQLNLENAQRVLQIHHVSGHSTTVPIEAPIAGTITDRNVNPGQVVDTSTLTPWQMFTITNIDRVWVDGDIYDKDVNRVRMGQPVTIQVASLPNHRFFGRVTYISSSIDPSAHTLKVRSAIDNPQGLLKNGMFADVALDTGNAPPTLLIPVGAVQTEKDQQFVLVETAPHDYKKRYLHTGPEKEGMFIVRDGLKAGERVVTHGGLFVGAATQEQEEY
jgi:cobalt-zinc-cadmium efflux system membrane fusion protein